MIETNEEKVIFKEGGSFTLSNPSCRVTALREGIRVVSPLRKRIDSMARVSTNIDCSQAPKAEFEKLERVEPR
jgi:hypothetical protein